MGLAYKQLKVYVRGSLLLVAAGAVGLVLWKNRANAVAFWFFGLTDPNEPINVVWLVLCTALASLIVWWIASLGWGLIRESREVRRMKVMQQFQKTQERKATEIEERERRLDEKLRKAIAQEAGENHGK